MWLSPKWFCFLFIYFVLYHGPEASKVQIKLTYLLHEKEISVLPNSNMCFQTSSFWKHLYNKLLDDACFNSQVPGIGKRPSMRGIITMYLNIQS